MTSINPATAEDRPKWVMIQMHTFTNWLNQQLMSGNVRINDLEADLSDGVLLIQVVETLQKRICTGKIYRQNPSEIQKLMNVQMALDALREDRVKLVNIGSQDIVEGNLKLILGLVWCLIQRYQIASHTKIPPKKLIMAWLQSALPEIKLTNFRTNWNDGVALSALLEYCQPGLFSDWRKLNPKNGPPNCARALSLAEKHLQIPAIISAEHFASNDLDELSTITYLSYFVKKGGPGYKATLANVQRLLPDVRITDFERSWNDGYLLSRLVERVGGSVPDLEQMQFDDPSFWSQNVARALDGALDLGIASLVGPDDISDIDVEHLGILALVAALSSLSQEQSIKSVPKTTERITSPSPMVQRKQLPSMEESQENEVPITTSCFQNQQLNLDLAFAEGSDVLVEDIDVIVAGPEGQILDNKFLELKKTRTEKGAVLSFIPKNVGNYEIHILCEQTELPTSPIGLSVLPSTQRSGSTSSVPPGVVSKSESSNSNQKFGKKVGEIVAALDREQIHQNPLSKSSSGQESAVSRSFVQESAVSRSFVQDSAVSRSFVQESAVSKNFVQEPAVSKNFVQEPAVSKHFVKESEPEKPKKMDYYGDQASLISFSGLTEPCSIGSIVEVVINAQGEMADSGDVVVFAESPSGRRQPCSIVHRENSFTASFTPSEVGEWKIGILYDDKHIKGSPFVCQVYDPNQVRVYGLDMGLTGHEVKFTVDAGEAGLGEVGVSILRHGKQIPYEIEEETLGPRRIPTGKFKIHFTPTGAGQYKIHIAYNNLEVKGSPFILDIADANSVSVYGDNLRMAAVDRSSNFMVHVVGAESKDLSVLITGPSNKRKQGRVIQIDESTFRIEWKPIEAGEHLIDVRLYDQSVYESPFICNVGDPDLVSVRKIPQFIDTRNLNKDHNFEIDATAAGSGNLEIVINGGRVACRVRELSPREFIASFTPTQRVPHVIEMKFNGEHVRGSPWTVSTRESSTFSARDSSGADTGYVSELVGVGLHRAAVGEPAVFEITALKSSPEGPLPEPLRAHSVAVKVTDPTGRPLETKIREQPSGVKCEYTVKTVGDHRLEVFINERVIDSGPLYVAGYDPRRITIKPIGGTTVGQPVQFMVDAVEAGKGQLEISVNQGRVPNNVQMKGAGRCLVTFIPQHPGVYVIDVTFNGHQIHGCPIRVEVNAKSVGKPVSATTSAIAPAGSTVTGSRATSSFSGHGVAGTSPPPPLGQAPTSLSSSPAEKTTFLAHSPRVTSPTYVDTSYSYSSSRPASRPIESPRSPQLVRSQQSPISPKPRLTDAEGLRSPRLLRQGPPERFYQGSPERSYQGADRSYQDSPDRSYRGHTERSYQGPPVGSPRVGHTVAQYGDDRPPSVSETSRRYFGEPEGTHDVEMFKTTYEQRSPPQRDTGTESSTFSPSSFSTPKREKYFEKEGPEKVVQSETRFYKSPDGGYTKRVEELTTTRVDPHVEVDYRSESRSSEKPRFEPIDTKSPENRFRSPTDYGRKESPENRFRSPSPTFVRRKSPERDFSKNYGTMGSHVYDEIPASPPPPPPVTLGKSAELERIPLEETPRRTADFMRIKEEDEKLLDKYGYNQTSERPSGESRHYSGSEQEQGIMEPYPSDLDSITPSVRRKTESQREEMHDNQSESAGSKPPSKPTTPKLSLRFGKSDKNKESSGPKLFDFGKSKITSKHEVVKRGKDVEVKVDNIKLSKEDNIKIIVTPPTKKGAPGDDPTPTEIPHKVKKSGKTYEISFRPTEVGTHKILVFVNDLPHPQVPFPIRVYDSSQIIVGDIVRESIINDTVEFTVDAGRAGFGNLEMAIKDSDGVIIPSHVSQLESGSAKFLVTFNPTSLGTHTVNVTFNKEVIKGSPFEVKIVENFAQAPGASEVSTLESSKKKSTKKDKKDSKKDKKQKQPVVERIPSLSRVGKPAVLLLSSPGGAPIEASVHDPSRKEISVKILEDEEGDEDVKQIQFTPQVVGDHEITIKVDGMEVTGSPFICRVHDPTRIRVGEIPSGVLSKPVNFIVDAADAGVGNLEVAVNEGTIASMARALGHHKYEISFVPVEAFDHKISIRFNNEPVPGSPFICKIGSQANVNVYGVGLERIPVGKNAEFVVQVNDDKSLMPEVEVTDPRGDKLPVTVSKDGRKGEYTVEYTPKVVGNHVIEIRYNNQPIGPAFTSKAFDASQTRLTLEEEAQVGKSCSFLIDAGKAGAGNMEIIVSVDGRNVPNYVQAESQAKFRVSFTPQEPRDHVISVKFNGTPVPGSPLRCPVSGEVSDSRRAVSPLAAAGSPSKSNEEIRLVGDLAVAQVGKPKGFSIDSPRRNAECNVIVTGPDRKKVPVQVARVDEGFDVEFLPTIIGEYEIDIKLDGKSLSICPIVCQCLEQQTKVGSFASIPEIVNSGEKVAFEVNTGKLTKKDDVRVEICGQDGSVIPANVKLDRSSGIAKVSCLLPHSGRYFVEIYKNNVPLGERIYFNASGEPTTSKGTSQGAVNILYFEKKAFVDRPTAFELDIAAGLEDQVHLEVIDPDGSSLPVSLSRLHGDTFAAEWIPSSEGPHTVSVKIQGKPVPGTPLTVSVLDLSAVRVIGLKNDAVGVQQKFNIDWSTSGGSVVSVSVQHEDGENVKSSLKKIKQGLHVCTFTPKKIGLYLLNIYIDEILLSECPYECFISAAGAVRARGDALQRAQRGKTARFEVSLGNATRGELDVLVTDSLQGPLPVRCYKQQDDSYWVEFTPEQIGTHQIEVTFAEVPVPGSPFKCEVVDPKKVVIKGADDAFTLRHIAKLAINRRAAGNGSMEVEVLDPQGGPLKVEQIKNSVGDDQITFLPVKLGPHKLSVKIAGFQVSGTPKTFLVEEQGKPTVYGAALDYAVEKDNAASMIFDPKKATGGIKVDVRSPEGEKIRHSTNKRPDGTSEISFRPNAVGLYKVSVEFNNKHVSGSPFQISVIDPKKVVINDENFREDGLLQLEVGKKNHIEVDTTAAGPGKLRTEVRDSEGELLTDIATVENLGYGKQKVTVIPKYPGNLKIYLYWAEQVVPTAFPLLAVAEGEGSPTARVIQTSKLQESQISRNNDIEKIQLKGEGLRKSTIKQPSEFIIDASDSPNSKITAQLIGDKIDIPVRLQHLGNNVHKAVYTPLQGGEYELHILADGKHVPGSPSTVDVRSHSSPSELVEVDSKSLKIGIIGEDVKTIIDTRKAGSGYLSAQCVGPSKLAYCELYDHRDGTYLLSLKPTELGKHTLVIKYSQEHVPGSPFVFNVSNPPDPSKVKVHGPGIDHGILHSFKSNFIVETKGAGAGQLTVRVRGPKGAFNVEMQRDKTQDRTIHCKYEPREPGDYQVEVKWHGHHVPGSPFFVMIVDTEEELKRFLAGEPPSQVPTTPFIPPGWVGPPPIPPPGMMPPGPGYPVHGNRRFYGPPPPGAFQPGPPPPALIHQQRRRHH